MKESRSQKSDSTYNENSFLRNNGNHYGTKSETNIALTPKKTTDDSIYNGRNIDKKDSAYNAKGIDKINALFTKSKKLQHKKSLGRTKKEKRNYYKC